MSASGPRRPGLRVTACVRRIEDDLFLCVSLNPAIDKRLRLEHLQRGRVNRAREVTPAPGGKAAHVAMVLQTLGADPLWLGFAGGPLGTALAEGLRAMSIRAQTVPTANSTRMNLEIIEDGGGVTEILEPGQPVTPEEIEQMKIAYESVLKESAGRAIAILSGSLPRGVAPHFYATLVELAHRWGCRVFLDTSGEPLRLALKSHPDLVKSNQEEAEELSGKVIEGPQRAGNALKEFLREGACSAAISLGKTGLLWQSAAEREVLFAKGLELNVRSTVGSGDATLAGFAFAAQAAWQPGDALRLAAACGAANCLAEGPGRARAADIQKLQSEIRVEVLS